MDNLLAARSQMGVSLAFHIIFAVMDVSLRLMRNGAGVPREILPIFCWQNVGRRAQPSSLR
ncbi:MAG: hypothetical protein WBC78_10885 [Candidatus Sulfotelmatobacter sp.]